MSAPYDWAEVQPLTKAPRLNPTLVLKTTPQQLADAIEAALKSVGCSTHERIAALLAVTQDRLDAVVDEFDECGHAALEAVEKAQAMWGCAYVMTGDERAVLERGGR